MSDQGEKTCPLCAEEMDLTDQQLKPCKCGYEICVWCWHHVMDMAEKEDESEGRCPACRSPYDKERIVGTAKNCGRLVAEINTDRKMKSQKTKTNKSSDGRKQLSSVRVIQRNLVYVVGLPFDLADEDLLQEKEYFSQYGKVLKVSMSRTTAGVIQQFPNNSCNVYITYSKEEEAIRCIQSVHGFVLEGRSLKACFGTTKYCHAWLRNMPCTNPDCLYLHEVGSQEDSFTKDEIISAYTRVQQITGATNNMHRRSGDMLPPPSDDFYINSSASNEKPLIKNVSNEQSLLKNASNSSASIVRVSPPNSSSGRFTALPAGASWGMRASHCQPPVASAACSNGHSNNKPDNFSGPLGLSSPLSSTNQSSTENGDSEKELAVMDSMKQPMRRVSLTTTLDYNTVNTRVKMNALDSMKQPIKIDSQTTASDYQVMANGNPSKAGSRTVEVNDVGISVPPETLNSDDINGEMCDPVHGMNIFVSDNGKTKSMCSEIVSSVDWNLRDEKSCVTRPNERMQYNTEPVGELLDSATASKAATLNNDLFVSSNHDRRLNSLSQLVENSDLEDDLQSFNDQRLKDPEFISSYVPKSDKSLHLTNHSREHSYTESYREANFNADPMFGGHRHAQGSLPHSFSSSGVYNGYPEDLVSVSNSTRFDRAVERSYMPPDERNGSQMCRFQGNNANISGIDMGENSIISNILSMDLDAWDDPLTSNQNLSKLLYDTNKQPGAVKLSSPWKVQNNNQSRFSFARQEECKNQEFNAELPLNVGGVSSFSQDFGENRVPNLDKLGNGNSFSISDMEEYNNICGSKSAMPSGKFSVSRAQVTVPPGFSVPNRASPPGFSSHDRIDQTFGTLSGGQLYNNSSSRNSYQSLPVINYGGTGDIEFIDPAIMAVGKGRLPAGLSNPGIGQRSSLPSQYGSFENEATLQMLMQRSAAPAQQNLIFSDIGNVFSPSSNVQSRFMEQPQANNLPQFTQLSLQHTRNGVVSNGHLDGWNHAQGTNNTDMVNLLRNERLGGYNKLYNGYEDSKFRMPSSGDLYYRTFGM